MTARFRPRWNKVLSDLWSNKIRSILVTASVAVGLFAVGMITTIHAILTTDMRDSYANRNPATITISIDSFDDDMLELAEQVDGVKAVQAVRSFDVQALASGSRWVRMNIKAFANIDDMAINQVKLVEGSWPPREREIVIEKNKRRDVSAHVGEWVHVELPDGTVRRLKLVGIVHDETIGASSTGGGYFMAPPQAYIITDTLEWLGQSEFYNLLYATSIDHPEDTVYLRALANSISNRIEDNGGLVYNANVRASHDHPNLSYTEAMSGVLFMLGGLVVFLSAFLITNTLSSLLNQQSQQIAIMKTVGARSIQIIGLYIALILVFGLLALLFSLPLSQQGAFRMVDFLSGATNFEVLGYRVIPNAVYVQIFIALLVPQIAGALPILRGSRIKVQEAFSGSLVEQDPERGSWIDRQLASLSHRQYTRRIISRPLLISLRNTFRRKVRLALTLLTLMLAGSIFIATFSVRDSLRSYIEQLSRYFVADVNLNLERPYRVSEIQQELQRIPGVAGGEGWAYARCEILLDNNQAGEAVQLLAPPSTTRLIDPMLISGRWVRPGDQNAIALSERFLSRFPAMRPGDTIRLRVNGKETAWIVVGFFQLAGKSAGYLAYTNYEYLTQIINQPNQASSFRVIADRTDLTTEQQRDLAARIEDALQLRGIRVSEVQAGKYLLENSADGLNTLTTFLLIMSLLTALVGSIGLMGTMSMNVMDRTREIGVMRAIGASDRAVINMVIVEGMLIGLISWLLGVLVSIPISKIMSDVITTAVFDAPARFTFSLTGPVYWLGLVLLLSVLASVIPARTAARITIREALAYE